MLAANGTSIPVTLHMTMRERMSEDADDSGGIMHVVQVRIRLLKGWLAIC